MKQLLCALICISILNISCKKDQEKPIKPVAEFIIVEQDFTAPCVVTFENISKNSSYYIWDFGNGREAFIPTPEITEPIASYYAEGGTYTVTLTTGGQGFNSVFTKQIVIKPSIEEQMPLAGFSFSNKTFYINEPIPLTNLSLRATSFEWFFSDGTYSSEKNPIKTFTSKGAYAIMLVASNEHGSDTSVSAITIAPTVYKRAMISSITVDDMPFENPTGSTWDASNGSPDVYFKILNVDSSQSYSHVASRVNDLKQNMLPYVFTLTNEFEIINDSMNIDVDFLDYDSPNYSEHIGKVTFRLSDYLSGGSLPIRLNLQQNKMKIRVNLVWK